MCHIDFFVSDHLSAIFGFVLKKYLFHLSVEVAVATDKQELVSREVKDVLEVLKRERSSGEEQLREIHSMRRQMTKLEERKEQLEKLISTMQLKKESLSNLLEIAIDNIFSLEKKQTDHEAIMRTHGREMKELKNSNNFLLEKLEMLSMSHSSSWFTKKSVMSEMDLSKSGSTDSIEQRNEELENYFSWHRNRLWSI